jgi:hypothetical protein
MAEVSLNAGQKASAEQKLAKWFVGSVLSRRYQQKHHIFPTRWVHHLTGWDDKEDSANLALNIMYVEPGTNGSWMNCDPRDQVEEVIAKRGSLEAAKELYRAHGITEAAFDILRKPGKTRQDFFDFIAEREAFFAGYLQQNFGFARPVDATVENDIDDDDER